MKTLHASIVLPLLLTSSLVHAAESLSPELQRGLFEEEANQNFEAAVRAYQSVLSAHDSERKLAATALFRLGECYRKLGRTNDAVTQYRRLVADFADQAALANLSRQNLVGLGVWTSPDDAFDSAGTGAQVLVQQRALAAEMAEAGQLESLVKQLTNRSRLELRRVLPTVAPDELLNGLLQQLSQEEQTLSALSATRTAEHPEVRAAKVKIAVLSEQIDERIDGVMNGLKVKADALAQKSETLKRELARLSAARRPTGKGEDSGGADPAARAQLRELLQSEIKIAEQFAAEQRKKVEVGTLAPGDQVRFERDVLNLKRQLVAVDGLVSAEDRTQWRELLLQEIKLAEEAARLEKQKLDVGKSVGSEVARLQRDVLILKRELVTFDVSPTPAAASATGGGNRASYAERLQAVVQSPADGGVTDEEAKEIRRIQALIKDSPDLINAVNVEVTKVRSGELMVPKNGTLLHKAASQGQLVVAKFLLEHGADVGVRDEVGKLPLHWAAGNGHKAMVELLLANKSDANAKVTQYPDLGLSPLHLAVQKGYRSLCETLLARGADPNEGDSSGMPPIYTAVWAGDEAILRLLLAKGAKVTRDAGKKRYTPLHSANNTNIARILIDNGAVVDALNSDDQTPLHIFANSGRREMVELLLAAGANPHLKDKDGRTPLYLAAAGRKPGAIAPLIARGANPNERNSYGSVPLDMVIRFGDSDRRDIIRTSELETLQELLAGGADPNLSGVGVAPHLFRAVAERYEDMAEALLKAGADPNAKTDFVRYGNDPKGQTALHGALRWDKRTLSLVNLLLEHKADPNLAIDGGDTPLFYAIASGSPAFADKAPFAETLLKHGANIEGRNSEGNTPLAVAVDLNLKEMVALLLRHKADPNAKTGNGSTVLHRAVGRKNPELVDMLLAAGANPNALDAQGMSALDYVKSTGSRTISSRPGPISIPVALPSSQPREVSLSDLADRLRKAGARDWAPRPGQITVTRRSTGAAVVVFTKGTNDWNRHSLLEALGFTYFGSSSLFSFPDFSKLTITRLDPASGTIKELTVDLLAKLAAEDCQADQWLEWGDLVDLPEGVHKLNEQWSGLPAADSIALGKCIARKVTLSVKGERKEIVLSAPNQWVNARAAKFFSLRQAVLDSGLLLTSSDTSRVKVKRTDAASGRGQEWIFDLSKQASADDLWLRDGDVIEVPEK